MCDDMKNSVFEGILVEHAWWRASTGGNFLDGELAAAKKIRRKGISNYLGQGIFWQSSVALTLMSAGIIYVYLGFSTVGKFLGGYIPAANLSSIDITYAGVSGVGIDNSSIQMHLWPGCAVALGIEGKKALSNVYGYELYVNVSKFRLSRILR